MKKLLVLAAFLAVLAGCRSLPQVYNVPRHTVILAVGKTMRQAILQGGEGRRWVMSETTPGVITGRLTVRGHVVEVKIPYTADSYAIEYAGSSNMKYNAKKNRIHPKYNQWVRNLDLNISRFAQKQ
ncbi:MAG: hypothetical protein PUK24_02765 [Elusimicrobia bacterium]|nr:hypothetical protein [Elusimicrobiota bacterium]MDY6039259.1 hypothetical protein [Elusimicrobiaceae bacterium]